MIKFILSDKKYSYKYDKHLSIKEVLNNFCKEKELPDIYEAYDPNISISLDSNKRLFESNLKYLHLRKIDSNISINQDSQKKLQTINSGEKLCNEQSLKQYSQNSFNQIENKKNNFFKKNKKMNFFKKIKDKNQPLTRSCTENLESSSVDNKITDKINQESLNSNSIKTEVKLNAKTAKKKRFAPPPPVKNVLTFYFENNDAKFKSIDLEIPQPPPPSTEFIGYYDYYPWQCCTECHTGDDSFEEESIYSKIGENHTPSPVSEFRVIEPPKCPSPNFSDDDIESANYIYSKIQKNSAINHIYDNSIETKNADFNKSDLHIDNRLSNDDNVHELCKSDSVKISTLENIFSKVSSESNESSISSSSNAVILKRNTRVPDSTNSLPNSLRQMEIDILTNQALQFESNLKKTSKFKSTEAENLQKFLKIVSYPSVKEFPENSSVSSDVKFPISKIDILTVNTNAVDNGKSNLTAKNEFLKYNSAKSPTNRVYKYRFKNTVTKLNEVSNSFEKLDKSSTKLVSVDDSVKIKKEGGSFYFSAVHN